MSQFQSNNFSIIETAKARVEGKVYALSEINFRCEHNENDDYEKFKQWNGIVVLLSRIHSIISVIIVEIFYCFVSCSRDGSGTHGFQLFRMESRMRRWYIETASGSNAKKQQIRFYVALTLGLIACIALNY